MRVLSAIPSSFILPVELKKIFILKSFVFHRVPREPPLALSFCIFIRKNRETEVLPGIFPVLQRIIENDLGDKQTKKSLLQTLWKDAPERRVTSAVPGLRGVIPPPLNSLEGTKSPATIGR